MSRNRSVEEEHKSVKRSQHRGSRRNAQDEIKEGLDIFHAQEEGLKEPSVRRTRTAESRGARAIPKKSIALA